MSLENDLKEAFERHATDALPQPDAWRSVERRVRKSERRRAVAMTAGAVAVIIAAAITIPQLGSRRGTAIEPNVKPTIHVPPSSQSPKPQTSPKVLAKIPAAAFAMATGADSIWAGVMSDHEGGPGRLVRIDPRTNRVIADLNIGIEPRGIAASADAVWVANSRSVMRVDPRSNRVVATIGINNPLDLAVGLDALWVVSSESKMTLLRIDPLTSKIAARFDLGQVYQDVHVSVGGGFAWAAAGKPSKGDGSPDMVLLHRVDPNSNTMKTFEVQGEPSNPDLVVDQGSVWIAAVAAGANSANGLARIDPSTGHVIARVTLPDAAPVGPSGIASGAGFIWVAGGRGSLWKVDPSTNAQVGDATSIGDNPPVGIGDVVTGFGSVWVASGDGQTWRLSP